MSKMAEIYEAVKHVLDAEIDPGLVPHENIRPSDDASEPDPGSMIYYNWQAGSWDLKARRGKGVFGVSCGSVDTKVDANEILDLVRAALTPRKLSYSGSPVRIQMFKETESLVDAGTTESDRSLAATAFSVLFVEA